MDDILGDEQREEHEEHEEHGGIVEEREAPSASGGRRGFWSDVRDIVFSIPPGIMMRIGG